MELWEMLRLKLNVWRINWIIDEQSTKLCLSEWLSDSGVIPQKGVRRLNMWYS